MIKISDKIYYLPHCVETDRPTLGYIKGEKYTLMIDSGNSYREVNLYLSELDQLNLPHPDFVAITHWHFDHTYGLSSLKATAIACKATNIKLENMTHWKWDEKSMDERVKNGEEPKVCQQYIKEQYPDLSSIRIRTADIVFDKHLTLDLGGLTCEMIWIDSSHTEDCVVYFIQEEKVLFIGDASYSSKDKFQHFIEFLEGLDFETIVDGHLEHKCKELAMSHYYKILSEL
ncbi:MAG: MBL fold metallo-hydrolase [Clostridium sp.]|uniref:MBL fold metallo-hydrolase n=1 Tax=Clostridium sp. TaxID=1506 RepID=UPI0030476354